MQVVVSNGASRTPRRRWPALLACGWLLAVPLCADDRAIVADIEAFFRTGELAVRENIVTRIESNPAYQRDRVSDWLHRADLFPAFEPGRHSLSVPLPDNTMRSVTVRVPTKYDSCRPWPLIYALHGTGGNADYIIDYIEHVLGPRIDQYIVSAPTGYEEVVIHTEVWPPRGEHLACLSAIKRNVHVNSDRVYALGYSRGGHAAWTLAVLHADRFAGAVPLASSFVLVCVDRLWGDFAPNLANTRLLSVWGAKDTVGDDGQPSPQGGIAGLNRLLRDQMAGPSLPIAFLELPNKGHGDVVPPPGALRTLLTATRTQYPTSVEHTFRHLYQGQAYWLEAHAWSGPEWTDKPVPFRRRGNEHPLDTAARGYRSRLGYLKGEVRGQDVRVKRKRIKELTVWFGDGMIAWDQPVPLNVSGRVVFHDRLTPDLHVCLTQAVRTYDFDRLRWAGLRFRSHGKTRVVDAKTGFPPVIRVPANRR